jgi:FkbM family methyltransferase
MNRKLKRKLMSLWFGVKNYPGSLFSVKRLDYPKKELFIIVDDFKEYEVRLHSCRKEPETVEWIEKFSSPDGVFYDVGANIGAYSLVAAANGMRVYAFEPAYPSFWKLNKNVSLNRFDDRIDCFPVALSVRTGISKFEYFDTSPGSSRGFYFRGPSDGSDSRRPEARKSTLSYSMDDFVRHFGLALPTMLKIDVDGGESEVVEGAKEILRSESLRTVLIEIDYGVSGSSAILDHLGRSGFALQSRRQRTRTIYNCILVKQGRSVA